VEGAVNILVKGGRKPEAFQLVQSLQGRAPDDPLLKIASKWLSGELKPPKRAETGAVSGTRVR